MNNKLDRSEVRTASIWAAKRNYEMPQWLGFVLAILIFGGLFWGVSVLMRRSQSGDASKRGQDASEPGGYYNEAHSGDSE